MSGFVGFTINGNSGHVTETSQIVFYHDSRMIKVSYNLILNNPVACDEKFWDSLFFSLYRNHLPCFVREDTKIHK